MEIVRWLEDLSKKARKKLIKKTYETYPKDWIIIHEALQNAIDAVRKNQKKDKTVEIEINPDENSVTIFDNGVGFPFDLSLLGFGESNKGKTDLGEIGVGIKVVIVSSKEFSIQAIYKDNDGKFKKWSCKILDGYKILTCEKEDLEIHYNSPEATVEQNTYTQVRYKLYEEISIVEWLEEIYKEYIESGLISAKLAEDLDEKFRIALQHYFRTRGYAADVRNLILGSGDVKIHLKILPIKTTSCTKNLKEILSKNVEINFENKYWDIEEIVEKTRRGFTKPRILTHTFPESGGNIGNYTQNHIYVQKFTNWNSIRKLISNPNMREPPNLNYFSGIVKKYVNAIYLVVGSREILRDYLVTFPRMHIISSCGIPSTHEIHSPSGVGFLGYLNNIIFIVDIKERLTYGKQTIRNTRVVGFINELFKEAFRTTLRTTVQSIVGVRERIEETPSPLVIPEREVVSREDIQPPILKIKKVPKEEIEVIAIFSEMIGRGILKEYEIWALSTRSQYDGKILIHLPSLPPSTPQSDRDLNTIEFKVNLSSLIEDFDNGDKYLEEINLIVIWEDDFNEVFRERHPYYEIIPVKDTELEELNLSYIEKCIHDRRTARKVPILELKQILNKLPQQ